MYVACYLRITLLISRYGNVFSIFAILLTSLGLIEYQVGCSKSNLLGIVSFGVSYILTIYSTRLGMSTV